MSSLALREMFKSKNPLNYLMGLKLLSFDESYKKIGQCISHPISKHVLNQKNFLPKSYNDLRNVKDLYFTNNFEGELAWMLKSIVNYKDKLNAFFKFEESLQKNILLGNGQKSIEIVEKINNEICYSYWSLENLFSIKSRFFGSEENWNLLKEFNLNVKNNVSLIFGEFFSKKCENEVTILQYKRELDNLISGLGESDSEFFIFRLGNIFYKDFKNLTTLLFIEGASSIIDQYLFFIELVYFLSLDEQNNSLVERILKTLKENGFNDYRIDRILEVNKSERIIKNFNNEIIDLFNTYSEGKYDECIVLCKELLRIQPECIEIYEIYIKSIIELNIVFTNTGISEVIDDILKSLYSLYSKKTDFYEAEESILKYYLSFSKINFFKQLASLSINISGSELNNSRNSISYFAFSKFSNPNIIMWNDFRKSSNFNINELEANLTLQINHLIGKGTIEEIDNLKIPQTKKDLYKARIGFYYKDKQSEEILSKLYNNENLNIISLEETIIYLFDFYITKNDIGSLLKILVDAYFKNNFLLKRIGTQNLLNLIINNNYYPLQANINLPIFFHIINAENYFQFASLDVYLNSIGLTKPSQISFNENDKTKQIYLLEKVCTLEVLNNFYLIFENDEEVLDERIDILRKLISVDDSNFDKYIEEIAVLSRKKRVDSTLQNYNDGKISLNFDRLKDDTDYSIQTSFNRFLSLREYSERINFKIVEVDLLVKKYLEDLENKEGNFQDASYIAFKSLFLEMVNVFLFSKEHGLDGDLSTRIRHGVLENKLRIVFKNNHLISIKNNDIYTDISYWTEMCNQLDYIDDILIGIQTYIKDFSKRIDDLIFTIKNDYIQIISYKHYTKEKAFFNYTFSEEYLWLAYNDVKETVNNYSEFQNYCFNFLKNHTEKLLNDISKIFKNKIKNDFYLIIDDFEKNIDGIRNIGGDVHSDIKQKIKYAKTQIEDELHEISKWFKLTTYFDVETLDIETIILTSLEIINNNIETNINPKITLPDQNYLVANGYSYIEIFKILFENALKHSNLILDDLNINVIVDEPIFLSDKDSNILLKLKIGVKNDVDSQVSENCNMDYISKNWNSSLINVNVEGGSGYQKINRILKYDIKALDSNVDFEITENTFAVYFNILLNLDLLKNEN